jgi:hypothetical protein
MFCTSWKRIAIAALAAFALVQLSPSQFPGPGLRWAGSSGTSAGTFLPTCTPESVAMQGGETVTLTVWGDFNTAFGLFAATSASQCVTFPGFGGGLVLDPPIVPVGTGVLTLVSPCLSCPEAFATLSFTVPRGLPSGVAVGLQALGFGGGRPAFTVAIVGKS